MDIDATDEEEEMDFYRQVKFGTLASWILSEDLGCPLQLLESMFGDMSL